MSFRDFNDEGPGTFEWDYVLGGNTTGLFPQETHYEIDGNTLLEVTFIHTGGGKYDPIYGNSWAIDNISTLQNGITGEWFTFEQNGKKYKAVINNNYKQANNCWIVDLMELL